MAITPLPTPPSRAQDSATFTSNANNFLDALPAFGTEANALAAEVSASEIAAVGAANYKGDYDASTTYAVGESVTYTGSQFIAKRVNTGVTPVDGANWLEVSIILSNKQTFTSSGTWTKPTGATWVFVEAISGGAGGGNVTGAGNPGGGSGGEYLGRLFRASDLSATETVTIGSGGAGGANGGSNPGATGGNSSFGAHLTAIGGNPGTTTNGGTVPRSAADRWNSTNIQLDYLSNPQAGAGGAVSSDGQSTIYGGAGGGGGDSTSVGAGGTSEFGGDGGAGISTASTKGGNGTAPGGGGGGSSNDGGGGDGADGQVIVHSW